MMNKPVIPRLLGLVLLFATLNACSSAPLRSVPTAISDLPGYVPHPDGPAARTRTGSAVHLIVTPSPVAVRSATPFPMATTPPRVGAEPDAVTSTLYSPLLGASDDATPDPRFGVVDAPTTSDVLAHDLMLLHATWFDAQATGGLKHALTQIQHTEGKDLSTLAQDAIRYPGRVWSMGGEPNG